MRASWAATHLSLRQVLDRRSSELGFQVLRKNLPELAAFPSIPRLLEHQASTSGDPAARYRVIRVLVAASQRDTGWRDVAGAIVLVALWPALDGVHARLRRDFPEARDEIAGEVVSEVGRAMFEMDLEQVQSVAGTLVRNTERNLRRRLVADLDRERLHVDADDPGVAASLTAPAPDDAQGAPEVAALLLGLRPADAELLRRVFVLGETQEEAGRALGLGPAAARKRYQRALHSLRAAENNPAPLSHSVPRIGL